MIKRVANYEVRDLVTRRIEFKTNNGTLFGQWEADDRLYVVYSYGYHFPMYAYDAEAQCWIGNTSKYSVTTSRHQTQARPSGEQIEHWFDSAQLRDLLIHGGLVAYIAHRMTYGQEAA